MTKNSALFKSVQSQMSIISPLFGPRILENLLEERGLSPETISAVDLFGIIKQEIEPRLKDEFKTEKGLLTIVFDNKGNIQSLNSFAQRFFDENSDGNETESEFFIRCGFFRNNVDDGSYVVSIEHSNIVCQVNQTLLNIKDSTESVRLVSVRDVTLMKALEDEVLDQALSLKKEVEMRKNIEEELRENQESLILSNRLAAVGQVASGISHEIMNPLSIISMNLYTMEKELKKGPKQFENLRDHLARCGRAIENSTKIVHNMRSVLHQERKPQNTEQSFLLQDVLTDIQELSNISLSRDEIKFMTNVPRNYRIAGNRNEIAQVLMNLLNNSVDVLIGQKEEKLISFSFRGAGDGLVIFHFTDTGPGIPLNHQHRIFDPLFTSKKHHEGTGLGLTISRQIMERNQGYLNYLKGISPTTFELGFTIIEEEN